MHETSLTNLCGIQRPTHFVFSRAGFTLLRSTHFQNLTSQQMAEEVSAQSHLHLLFESRAEGCYRTTLLQKGCFALDISECADFCGGNGHWQKELYGCVPKTPSQLLCMVSQSGFQN